jgi:hypothetical protein
MTAHCCDLMAANINTTCKQHPHRYDCPDALVDYWPNPRTYGLIVQD